MRSVIYEAKPESARMDRSQWRRQHPETLGHQGADQGGPGEAGQGGARVANQRPMAGDAARGPAKPPARPDLGGQERRRQGARAESRRHRALTSTPVPRRPEPGFPAQAASRLAEINAAYEILGDKVKRKAFDSGEIAEGNPLFQGIPPAVAQGSAGLWSRGICLRDLRSPCREDHTTHDSRLGRANLLFPCSFP